MPAQRTLTTFINTSNQKEEPWAEAPAVISNPASLMSSHAHPLVEAEAPKGRRHSPCQLKPNSCPAAGENTQLPDASNCTTLKSQPTGRPRYWSWASCKAAIGSRFEAPG